MWLRQCLFCAENFGSCMLSCLNRYFFFKSACWWGKFNEEKRICKLFTFWHVLVTHIFSKLGHPGLFFVYFRHFKPASQFLQQIVVKICPSSTRYLDSNPQLSEHESHPIITWLVLKLWILSFLWVVSGIRTNNLMLKSKWGSHWANSSPVTYLQRCS